ncbi:hypothetical protein SAY87_018593 [Trapa incisa]|uniref:Uncharacterized protein n=1 Tax=Trapa incisa TaxID=236973 RepID=A0AAN7L3P9_9MYRT|nr:hypothetical protein SAY87_018593 [Trapa incisa]
MTARNLHGYCVFEKTCIDACRSLFEIETAAAAGETVDLVQESHNRKPAVEAGGRLGGESETDTESGWSSSSAEDGESPKLCWHSEEDILLQHSQVLRIVEEDKPIGRTSSLTVSKPEARTLISRYFFAPPQPQGIRRNQRRPIFNVAMKGMNDMHLRASIIGFM